MVTQTIILIISIVLLVIAYILRFIPSNTLIPFLKIARNLHPISFIAGVSIPLLLI